MKSGEPLIIVALYLRGDRLQPDKVSELLKVQPSEEQRKGALIAGSETAVAKIGLWALLAQTESRSIAEQVDELLGKLIAPRTRLDQIDGVDEAYLDIFVAPDYSHAKRKTMESMLTRKQIADLDRLGVDVHITVS